MLVLWEQGMLVVQVQDSHMYEAVPKWVTVRELVLVVVTDFQDSERPECALFNVL